jgi:hypothetical protein
MTEQDILDKMAAYETYTAEIPINNSSFIGYENFDKFLFRVGLSTTGNIYSHDFNRKYDLIFLRFNETFHNIKDGKTFLKYYDIGQVNSLDSIIYQTFIQLDRHYNPEIVDNNIRLALEKWQIFSDEFDASKYFKKHIQNIKRYLKRLEKLNNLDIVREELDIILKYSQDISAFARKSPDVNIDSHVKELLKLIKNKSYLINKEGFRNIQEFMSKNKIIETCELIRVEFSHLYEKTIRHVWSAMNQSHLAIPLRYNNIDKHEHIIKNKHWSFNINLKNNRILHFFNDNSVLLEHGESFTSIPDNTELFVYINEYCNDLLHDKLHKHPYVLKKLKSMTKNNNCLFVIDFCNYYLENKDILKLEGFNLIEQTIEDLEKIFDNMLKIVNNHKLNKYTNSIISNKYKHLYDETSLKLFKTLMDMKVTENQLQSLIGKKIALFKTSSDLNKALQKQIDIFDGFTIDAMIDKFKRNNINNYMTQNNLLICEIENYLQSVMLGSSSWCICYSNSLFNKYTENEGKQYFIYDFSKKSNSMSSMIGISLNKKGEYVTAHQKDDTHINQENVNRFIKLINKNLAVKNIEEQS